MPALKFCDTDFLYGKTTKFKRKAACQDISIIFNEAITGNK